MPQYQDGLVPARCFAMELTHQIHECEEFKRAEAITPGAALETRPGPARRARVAVNRPIDPWSQEFCCCGLYVQILRNR